MAVNKDIELKYAEVIAAEIAWADAVALRDATASAKKTVFNTKQGELEALITVRSPSNGSTPSTPWTKL